VSTVVVGSLPLGGINIGLNGAVSLVVPLLVQFDLMLMGQFGLGSLLVDLSAQLNAAINLQLSFGISISNPFASLKLQLTAIAQIQASIQAALSLGLSIGLPAISVSLSASLSAAASISATLALKLGGINFLIKAALAIKLPVVDLMASLTANLSAGPCVLLSIGFDNATTLAESGNQYQALTAANLGGINPGEQVWGVIMLTKVPSASIAMSAIIKTS
jgi:hypothetical protein